MIEENEPENLDESPEEKTRRLGARILAALDTDSESISFESRVYRIKDTAFRKGGEEIYLFDVKPEDMANIFEKLRDGYGSGKYRVRVRQLEADGGNKLLANVTLNVEAPPGWIAPAPPAIEHANGAAPAGENNALLLILDRQQKMIENFLTRPPAPAPAAAFDMAEMLSAYATIQTNVIAQQPKPLDPMELFKLGAEFAGRAGGGAGGDDDSYTGLLRAFAPIVDRVVQAAQQAPAPAPAAQQYLLQMLHNVASFARQVPPVDVAKAADFVFDNVPFAMIRQLVEDRTMLDQLAMGIPAVRDNLGYFSALREELRKGMMAGDGGPAPNDTSKS